MKERELQNEQHLRGLAKKIVDAYKRFGEEAYYNAFLSASRGDKELTDILTKFVEEELKAESR